MANASGVFITTLCDNIAGHGFKAEWGFALLIEANGKRILFDSGATSLVVENARVNGIDLSHIDNIILSHGHMDHTGGLLAMLSQTGRTTVVAHPDIWEERYVLRPGKESPQSIGIPFSKEELEKRGAVFVLSREPVSVTPNIITSGEIPMVSSYEHVEDSLQVIKSGVFIADKLADDLSLIISTNSGLVVILGCAHRGVVNTLFHARKLTGISRVAAVIGGMHLLQASDERIRRTITDLKAMEVQRLVVSHCTGFRAATQLSMAFEASFIMNCAGAQLVLP